MDIDIRQNFVFLTSFFSEIREGVILIDKELNIIYKNSSAKNILGKFKSISDLEHQFSFDICILNYDDILNYNPLREAAVAIEKFKTEALFQFDKNQYKRLLINSFDISGNKIIFFSDLSAEFENIHFRNQILQYTDQINRLEEDKKENSVLKERAEALAIRTGLINRISTLIRDTLSIDEIINIAVSEISKTLGVYIGLFCSYSKDNKAFNIREKWQNLSLPNPLDFTFEPQFDFEINNEFLSKSQVINSPDLLTFSGELKPRLISPVIYQGEFLGILVFYHKNLNREWHQEEISLVEGLAAQLAAAIYQATLFERLDNQNNELERALLKLKETQSQLVQSEKMASLGQLVAGVAHEINTPVGAVNSNNDLIFKCLNKIKSKVSNFEEIKAIFDVLEDVEKINSEAIRRINEIIKSLKNFARLDEAEFKEVDIHEGLKNTILLINHEIKNRIKIIEDYGNLPLIKCYPNLLNQVFMNILVNSYQSIDGDGVIKIRTELIDNKARIIISDTGRGIEEEYLNKIFDPGFTTKGVGVGTGLGLSICYQIIEKHNGEIKVDSKINQGTTFTVEIPAG